MIFQSVKIHRLFYKLSSNQLELAHSGFRNISQKCTNINNSWICCEVFNNVETIWSFLVKPLSCCWGGRFLWLSSIKRVASKFDLHIAHMESQFYNNATWVWHDIVNVIWPLIPLYPEGDSNILNIFRKQGMDLVDVGISEDVRTAINTLLTDLTNFYLPSDGEDE